MDVIFIEIRKSYICTDLSIGFHDASLGNLAILTNQRDVNLRVCHTPTDVRIGSDNYALVKDGTFNDSAAFHNTIRKKYGFAHDCARSDHYTWRKYTAFYMCARANVTTIEDHAR